MNNDAKQYLISFLATLKGDKAVTTGLTRMQTAVNKTRKGMGIAGKQTKDFGSIMTDLGKRALLTIPVWLLLRGVIMGLIRTIGDMIGSNIKLEEQLARIKTVMHGTAMEIDSDMVLVKKVILDMAIKSRLKLEELAEGFYFLRTANLDTKQAIEAFEPALALAVGTGNSLKETTRALAGVYNTMGKSIAEATTDAEKFSRIADVLAFTYATQDVQLSELIASYEKFAPFVSGLDDSFVDVVTTLGFLNTRLLRSGRAGRLTGRAIIQLSKNADKLAEVFDITFDPDKPINFVRTMKQIHSAISTGTKLTEKQSRALQDIFATRGVVPIRLLLESFEEWTGALELAGVTAEGFAEKMESIRMNTISAQAGRMKGILAVLANEFISGTTSGGSFAETLKIINDALASARGFYRAYGRAFGFVFANVSKGVLAFETLAKSIPNLYDALNPFKVVENFTRLNKVFDSLKKQDLSLLTWSEYNKSLDQALEKTENEKKVMEEANVLGKDAEETSKIRTGELKKQKAELANQVKLLKIAGVHEKDIAQFKVEQFENLAQFMTLEEEAIARLKVQNELIQSQAKLRKEMVTTLQSTALSLLKTMGASESQILDIKLQQLYADRQQIGETKFLVSLTNLRYQQQLALVQEKQKEMQVATNLYLQYKKADEFERTRLRRLMELRQLDPTELAKRYKEDMFDQRVIDEYFSHFSQTGQQAIGEVLAQMFDLDATTVPGLTVPPADQLRDLLNPETANPFWDNWDRRARTSIEDFSREWSRVLSREGGIGLLGIENPKLALEQTVDLKTVIENLSINLPPNALTDVAEEAGRQVTESLLNNESFQKKFIDKIRNVI